MGGLGSEPIHFWSRTPTFGFIICLIELNVLIPKKKKLFRSDELRERAEKILDLKILS